MCTCAVVKRTCACLAINPSVGGIVAPYNYQSWLLINLTFYYSRVWCLKYIYTRAHYVLFEMKNGDSNVGNGGWLSPCHLIFSNPKFLMKYQEFTSSRDIKIVLIPTCIVWLKKKKFINAIDAGVHHGLIFFFFQQLSFYKSVENRERNGNRDLRV